MATAAAVITSPGVPPSDADLYRPAGVFISYASEDHDIAQAVYQSLQAVGETVFDRTVIFLDSKSIQGGDEIREDIIEGLRRSDFLIVLYTGLFKRSHGYTGWEVGFFAGLIEEEKAKFGEPKRKIIYLYSGELPSIGTGIRGINIDVDRCDLIGSRTAYEQKSIQSPDDPDLLARTLFDIANLAESRLPPPLNDENALELRRARRRQLIAQKIVPNLKGKLFDCMETRITRGSVEQKLIEFDLPKPGPNQTYITIPDEAKLTAHSGAFEIFSISQQNDTLTWSEFCKEIKASDALGGASILLAIEQALVSAISPALRIDNDQILKAANGTIFRVLVTRQSEYFNGRRIIHVYFIQKLEDAQLGDAKTSAILGFINVAAKYRFIFIEQGSPLSVQSFRFEHDATTIQNKVRQLIRELLLIEEESHNLKLDEIAAISWYFGPDEKHLSAAKSLQDKWLKVRGDLMASAEKLLSVAPTSDKFSNLNDEWLATLDEFRSVSDEINSTATIEALENLKQNIIGEKSVGSTAR